LKRFRFSLEGLLRVKSARRRAAQSDAHLAAASAHEAAELVHAVEKSIDDVRRENVRALEKGCAAEKAARGWLLDQRLARWRVSATEASAQALEHVEKTREALVESRREERVIERVKERRKAAHLASAGRTEQREADDRSLPDSRPRRSR